MRWFLACLGLAGVLHAQAALHIVAVERRGPPPYETADRIYRLDGGQDRGLRVGDRLIVKRAGEVTALGHLWVTAAQDQQSETRFEPTASSYPMKGDLALREELTWMPEPRRLDADPIPGTSLPRPAIEAPPREGILYFLPQRAELSPAGLKKLEAWVQEWGSGGRWSVQVPTAKATKAALQKQRAGSLQAALRALGIEPVKVETEPRATEGRYDPAWIRHWDGPANQGSCPPVQPAAWAISRPPARRRALREPPRAGPAGPGPDRGLRRRGRRGRSG